MKPIDMAPPLDPLGEALDADELCLSMEGLKALVETFNPVDHGFKAYEPVKTDVLLMATLLHLSKHLSSQFNFVTFSQLVWSMANRYYLCVDRVRAMPPVYAHIHILPGHLIPPRSMIINDHTERVPIDAPRTVMLQSYMAQNSPLPRGAASVVHNAHPPPVSSSICSKPQQLQQPPPPPPVQQQQPGTVRRQLFDGVVESALAEYIPTRMGALAIKTEPPPLQSLGTFVPETVYPPRTATLLCDEDSSATLGDEDTWSGQPDISEHVTIDPRPRPPISTSSPLTDLLAFPSTEEPDNMGKFWAVGGAIEPTPIIVGYDLTIMYGTMTGSRVADVAFAAPEYINWILNNCELPENTWLATMACLDEAGYKYCYQAPDPETVLAVQALERAAKACAPDHVMEDSPATAGPIMQVFMMLGGASSSAGARKPVKPVSTRNDMVPVRPFANWPTFCLWAVNRLIELDPVVEMPFKGNLVATCIDSTPNDIKWELPAGFKSWRHLADRLRSMLIDWFDSNKENLDPEGRSIQMHLAIKPLQSSPDYLEGLSPDLVEYLKPETRRMPVAETPEAQWVRKVAELPPALRDAILLPNTRI